MPASGGREASPKPTVELDFVVEGAGVLETTPRPAVSGAGHHGDHGQGEAVAAGIHRSARVRGWPRLTMHRLGFSAVLLTGVVLVLGSGVAGQVRPAESMRERQAVARIAARGLPLYCGGGRTREVALTFDDGPTTHTPRLLEALREASRSPSHARVPATFFLIGQSAARYRSYAGAEAEVGSVGAHTQTHTTLTGLEPAAARREIVEGKRSVERALGELVQLFRPTGGRRSPAIDRIVASSGLLTVMWTVDPRDWARTDPLSVATAVASDPRLVPGAIVVLHEFNLATIEAVPAIVRNLRRRGLLPVTVPRLLADDPPTLAEQREDARAGSCVHVFRGRG